ncbi:tail assembly protein [Yersinia ruckeri]|uniref:tail assembly protein n=1 Tax=Yersinia ruckeri TaxID=29486 RepID=UPI001F4494EB|nr:tail assembly protein [Yersinia ruckeri]UIN00100.1 tail assembly protein [Yersinia ruckeri]
MATTHALPLATPKMARVCLYGDLQRFGHRFDLSIKTGAEGVHALAVQIPAFKKKLMEGWYQIRIAGRDLSPDDVAQRLHDPLPEGAVIHIVPRMAGAGKGGVFQIVLGAVAIAAAFFTGGASLVAWSAFQTGLFTFGASLVLGGVAQMLSPQPNAPHIAQTDNGKQNTYFSSLDNLVAQGNPLPVLYGEMQIGGRVISQELSTRDEGSRGRVVVMGR